MTENSNDNSLNGRSTSERTSPPTSSSSSLSSSHHENLHEANNQRTKDKGLITTPFNHFENYFQMKSKSSVNTFENDVDTQHHDGTNSSFSIDTGNKGEGEVESQYNHFTAPFKSMMTAQGRDATTIPSSTSSSSSSSSTITNYERSKTFDRFANIFMERMGEVMSSGKLSQAWRRSCEGGGDGAHNGSSSYALERDMVKPHITPIVWGSSCVLVTLFSMRCGRWYQQQQLRSLWRTSSGGTMTGVSTTTTSTMRQRHPSLLDDVRVSGMKSRQNNFNNTGSGTTSGGSTIIDMTIPVDISLSLLFGISTTIFLSDKQRLLHDFAHAPLVEGRSVLAEELCMPFQKEIMENNKDDDATITSSEELFQHDENLGDFDSLRAIRDFVIHCHMREKRIQRDNQ